MKTKSPSMYPPPNRPVAMGVNGMVAAAHPLASGAGVRVLAEGGNAFDAAVCTAATLNVVEPYMSGVGGIGIGLVYVASEERVRALNFSGRAPMASTPDTFTDEEANTTGILASMVPGNLAGWLTLHETYGSMDRERLFRPAMEYAENGFPFTYFNHKATSTSAPRLSQFPTSASILLDSNGLAHRPGARVRMPQLGVSLRKMAKDGLEVFYRGEIAEKIVMANREMGGLITADDLAGYQPEWQEPISADYRGYQVVTVPPNSSAFQVLQTLKLMEGLVPDPSHHDPDTMHLLMEAIKLAVTDRIEYAGDPDHTDVPVAGLLSDRYIASQAKRVDPDQVAIVAGERYAFDRPEGALSPGNRDEFDGGMTTHFAVADRDGNVVTITQTLGGGFGSALAIGDTGIFLNNMMTYFELDKGNPNQVGPGKRVDFVIAPTQTFRDGKLVLSIGTPGSFGILQTTPQMLMDVLDYKMSVQQAIESPRFKYAAERHVDMEERFPLQVRRELERRGHEVGVLEAWSAAVGGAQGIQVDMDQGVFQGGADPRRDGYAFGL